jgi:hypothetical protein
MSKSEPDLNVCDSLFIAQISLKKAVKRYSFEPISINSSVLYLYILLSDAE